MNNPMNEKNLEYLKNQVFFSGFGKGLEKELQNQIEKELPEFTLVHKAEFGKDVATSALSFRKSENSDMYFFNKYTLAVLPDGAKEPLSQTFYVGRENNITLKEAYNLMSGRAIHKEFTKMEKAGEGESARYKATDEKYKAWMKLDLKDADVQGNFKQVRFHEKYGFDLEKALAKYPVKELENETYKERLIESLQKGNLQSVTFKENGQEAKHYVEANPKDRSVNIYDAGMQRIFSSQSQADKLSKGENQAAGREMDKDGQKQKDNSKDIPGQKEGKNRKKGQAVA